MINDLLMDIPTADIKRFEQGLFEQITVNCPDISEAIAQSGQLSEETEERIRTVIAAFKKNFLGQIDQ